MLWAYRRFARVKIERLHDDNDKLRWENRKLRQIVVALENELALTDVPPPTLHERLKRLGVR